LTGAGACGAFLLAPDGIPLRATGFCNVNELFEANSEQAGRIEVIRGPSGVIYGSNAMHGVINILSPGVEPVRRIAMEAGPHDYYRARASVGSETLRLDGNAVTDGGYKHDSGFDQQKLTLKHVARSGQVDITTSLSMTNLNQETAGFIRGTDAYRDSDLRETNPNPEAFRDVQSVRLHSRLTGAANGGQFVLTPYLRWTDMRFLQHFLPGQALEENSHRSFGIQASWHSDRWTVGVDAEQTSGELREHQPEPTTGSAFLVATIPAGDHYDYEVDAARVAAFAQYQWHLSDASLITLGTRAETVNYDYDNHLLNGRTRDDGTECGFGGCRFNRPADRQDRFSSITSSLGFIHDLSSQTQLYSLLSRGFRAPQATELYRLQGDQAITNIDSEALDSFELGVRGSINSWQFDVSVYSMNKDNFIFRNTSRMNVDNGETSHRGLEITTRYAMNDAWSINLQWSFANHQYENNPALSASPLAGNEVDTAPASMGSMQLGWHPSDTLKAELEWVHLGDYYQDAENQNSYAGHDLMNLRLVSQLSPQTMLSARITNLTNTDYAERADYAFGQDRYFVGEPLSAYLSISYDF
jgi:outer membrane receptor protein involved in Fe transport